ncbi:unnamed protein product, partial [Prorocentrum cordatum]
EDEKLARQGSRVSALALGAHGRPGASSRADLRRVANGTARACSMATRAGAGVGGSHRRCRASVPGPRCGLCVATPLPTTRKAASAGGERLSCETWHHTKLICPS